MAIQKIKEKSFTLKKDAQDWAKDQKKKQPGAKWEVRRNPKHEDRPWKGVIFKDV